MRAAAFALALFLSVVSAMAQGSQSAALGELNSLTEKVKDADTRVRVAAFHEVWSIALASDNSEVKLLALDLLREPVGSSSTRSACRGVCHRGGCQQHRRPQGQVESPG